MFIITTRKRIIQITLSVILVLVSLLAYIGFTVYRNTVLLPQQLIHRLTQAANGEAQLLMEDYNRETLLQNIKDRIAFELSEDLAKAGLPEGMDAMAYLIEDASQFLENETLFHQWLTIWLKSAYESAGDQVFNERISVEQRLWHLGEQCLLLTFHQHIWRLESFDACPITNAAP